MQMSASPEDEKCPTMVPVCPPATAPKVIGLYGVPGAGKTFLMNRLKEQLGEERFAFFEGSEVIASVTTGGLDAFKKLDESEKAEYRKRAVQKIKSTCSKARKVGIVTGHLSFWDDERCDHPMKVVTEDDLDTFTHILYLNTPLLMITEQRKKDTERLRPIVSESRLCAWQNYEIKELSSLCMDKNIMLAYLWSGLRCKLSTFIHDIECHDEEYNMAVANDRLDKILSNHSDDVQTVLFLDADKTLSEDDTSETFWKMLEDLKGAHNPLRRLFNKMGQAMMYCETEAWDDDFSSICDAIASKVKLYPQISLLLEKVVEHKHVCPVIVTSGLRLVWEKVIEREGLADVVKVIGGGRINDGLVVTPGVKRSLVVRAREVHGAHTWAIGDSPIDLPMMMAADKAVVVVGKEQTRSKSMDGALRDAILNDGLQARQVLLPYNSLKPRLDPNILPVIHLEDENIQSSIFCRWFQFYHATDDNASKLLSTPMRDDAIRGPALQDAHRKAAHYLSTKYLAQIIGLEPFPVRHPQNKPIDGYRLFNEGQTLIVPLMRGGLPMANGVNEVFPTAQLLHAKFPHDNLEGIVTVILVDSVINSGKSIVEFLQHIKQINDAVRVIVVAGVAQDQAIKGGSAIRAVARSMEVTIVALRVSKNKYTGKGTTDTGNRLFNTTQLD
ncbi:hypothetical protein ASPTUDRAFT_59217 [Aspergillus tubingensis CBS 134.48]|uniref:Phosphoribosyltransferase domain-containing protein n=1 Tax=Aspergillus tubingensis (strain CBS 134.48) TaxID=767770 RepID=A0A1L9MU66_ASPTC|nr:hypothetical protein ASPTUDRAFT_59217 [Aspergillus tubingensis CBS 134.48]